MYVVNALVFLAVLGLALGANWALAQEAPSGDLEITMTLMPEDADLPGVVTQTLTLPEFPEGNPSEGQPVPGQGQQGLDVANDAHQEGRNLGQGVADAAQQDRDVFGHGSRPEDPGPPPGVPEPPGDALEPLDDGVPEPPDALPVPPDGVPPGPP